MMIYDAMSGAMPESAKRISLSHYKWQKWPVLTDLNYLVEDINGYSTQIRWCIDRNSKNGIIGPYGDCQYYMPLAIKVIAISIAQFVALAPIGLIIFQYIKSEVGYRG